MPNIIMRILSVDYNEHCLYVGIISQPFTVANSVHNGGMLVYVDELIITLND